MRTSTCLYGSYFAPGLERIEVRREISVQHFPLAHGGLRGRGGSARGGGVGVARASADCGCRQWWWGRLGCGRAAAALSWGLRPLCGRAQTTVLSGNARRRAAYAFRLAGS